MATVTGWTWDYIEEELDIPRLAALSKYWRSHPPVHVLVASFFGFKAPPEPTVGGDAELHKFLSGLQMG